jgi:hypothetical protein
MTPRGPAFSRRTDHAEEENLLTQRLRALRKTGPICDLTVGNPTEAGIPYDVDGVLRAFAKPEIARYEPLAFGAPEARALAADTYASVGTRVPASDVILFASTSEAYASLLKVLCDAGDNVLVPAPSYPLFAHLAAFEQVQLRTYPLRYDGAWHIDMPALRAACTDRTRAVFVVSPNNPTGSYLKASELEALAALGLPVVSDEVFAEYPLRESNERVRTVAGSTLPLSFALAGLSKLSGFPQMKAAWCAVSGEARHKHEAMRRLELVCDTFLGVGAPVQAALEDLLALGHNVRASIRTRTQTNLSLLRKALADTPASVLDVEGGWYAVVRLPATKSEDEWVLGLLGTHRVLVHPGAFFDFDSEPFCVVSLLPAPLAFADGVEALRQSAMDA